MFVFIWKQYPKKLVFWILRIFELFVRKVWKFLSERIRCFSLKISTKCFHVKTKILADFLICISVPLKILICLKRHTFSIEHLHKSYLHRRFVLTYIWITKLLKKLFREVHLRTWLCRTVYTGWTSEGVNITQ